jgi:hypothetical protein
MTRAGVMSASGCMQPDAGCEKMWKSGHVWEVGVMAKKRGRKLGSVGPD